MKKNVILDKSMDFLVRRGSRQVRKKVLFAGSPSVLELALQEKIEIPHSCGGMASCGTCHIFVKSDLSRLDPPNEPELEIARDMSFPEHERLACQITAFDGLVVEIPEN